MQFEDTALKDVVCIHLEPAEDARGFFARAWCRREMSDQGLEADVAQCNLSYNRRKGTIRGLHFQKAPFAEVKYVRCIRGAVYDVVVDLRSASPTYLKWIGIELSAENRTMLYVPKGFAHGFQTLCDDTELFYQVSTFYTPSSEGGIRWNDPFLNIQWPHPTAPIVSPKDRSWPDFAAGTS